MPQIYYLNPPPNPFWDFVAGIEDHPFFGQRQRPVPPTPPRYPPRPETEQAQTQAAATAAATEASEKAQGKQPESNVEDPPEMDPSTLRGEATDKDTSMPFRGRGRFAQAFEDKDKDKDDQNESSRRAGKGHCGHPHGRRGWNHRGPPPFGPPPFIFGPHAGAFYGHRETPTPGHEGPEGRGPPCGFRGRGGRHGHRHGPTSRSPPHGGPFGRHQESGFDLGAFLNKLGDRLGVDLTSAAEGLGLNVDRSKPIRSDNSDFEPRTDIFDTASHYTIHLSLPGAKKSDVGVDWDGEHSALRIAGVVHRPGVDEEMMARLVVDGRKREVGVFEKIIRLGTQREPASIDVQGITAKMVDGVLIVRVPKVEKKFAKKEVRVEGSSPEVSTERPEDTSMNEKDLLFDAEGDEDMYDTEPTQASTNRPVPAKASVDDSTKGKQGEAEEVRDDRSETVDFEHAHETIETLPRYEVDDNSNGQQHADDEDMSDWERAGSEDEGEYVKINVD